jgi:pimeloyl-ACP methyl ester carboxylesterase
MPMKPVRDEFIVAGDLTFHYIKWGEQGTPIICVHGLTANAFYYQALADKLARHHQVFAYDLRGRGDSDKPERGYSVPIHAADLAKLIHALGLERPIVIGHSLGALTALYFASHYPEILSKLVLVDAGAPLPWNALEEQPAWLKATTGRLGITVPSFEEYIHARKLAPFLGPYWNEYVDLYFERDVRRNRDGSVASKCSREAVQEEESRYSEAAPEQQWANVRVPTLLLRAGQSLLVENDQLVPEASAAAVQRGIKDCHYVNFPTLNHYTILFGVEDGPTEEIQSFVG